MLNLERGKLNVLFPIPQEKVGINPCLPGSWFAVWASFLPEMSAPFSPYETLDPECHLSGSSSDQL
jgi:hypothetical protein